MIRRSLTAISTLSPVMLHLLATIAHADDGANPVTAANDSQSIMANPSFSNMMMLVVMFAILYFVVIRPQQKKMREHREMIDNLTVGTKLLVNNSIIGTLVNIDKQNSLFTVEVAPNVQIKVLRDCVAKVVDAKGSGEADAKNKTKKDASSHKSDGRHTQEGETKLVENPQSQQKDDQLAHKAKAKKKSKNVRRSPQKTQ